MHRETLNTNGVQGCGDALMRPMDIPGEYGLVAASLKRLTSLNLIRHLAFGDRHGALNGFWQQFQPLALR